MSDPKADLHRYLRMAREVVLWKLEGLSEYDVRRPVTPTGTNLLGLVKHLAYVEIGYFGQPFGRPSEISLRWGGPDAEPDTDLWAAADESREWVVSLYRQAWSHADATIDALPLDARGRVAHWPSGRNVVTLHSILVHVTAETHRHAGHADIVRELIDGAVGLHADNSNLPEQDPAWWSRRREALEEVARTAGGPGPGVADIGGPGPGVTDIGGPARE